MLQTARGSLIPNFLSAGSPVALRRLMLRNNVKYGGFVKYMPPVQAKDGTWFVWFYADIRGDDELISESKTGEVESG